MDPYTGYREYQRRTKDMYHLLRYRKAIYCKQQQDSGEPDRSLVIRSTEQPQIRLKIPVNRYTTMKQLKERVAYSLGERPNDISLVKCSPYGQEKIYNYPCVLDYDLQDGDELYLVAKRKVNSYYGSNVSFSKT